VIFKNLININIRVYELDTFSSESKKANND